MPPASKKAKAPTASDVPAQTPASTLVARCSRSALEAFVLETISGNPVTYEMLCASLPESKRMTTVAKTTIAIGQSREGTGLFDLLGDEILLAIVSQVHSTETRLHCAIAVCKAWRTVLKCPEMFSRIALKAGRYAYLSTGALNITSSNALRLLNWLPDPSAVASLEVDSGDKHDSIAPDVLKKALARLTNLKHLSLSGKKVTSAVITVAAKQPFAAHLEEVAFDSSVESNDLFPLLSQSCRLQSLTVHQLCLQDARSLARAWRMERGGEAVPLLTKLEVTSRFGSDTSDSWESFSALPDLFPELERLTISFKIYLSDFSGLLDPLGKCDALPLSFRRLTTLRISSVIANYSARHLTTSEAGLMLRNLLTAIPNVKDLSITHGTAWSGTVADRKAGRQMNAAPGLDGALANLPPFLERLSLNTFILEPTDFDMTTSLASLRFLSLTRCGPHATQIAKSLVAGNERCPRLKLALCDQTRIEPEVAAAFSSGASRPGSAMEASSRPTSALATSSAAGSSDDPMEPAAPMV